MHNFEGRHVSMYKQSHFRTLLHPSAFAFCYFKDVVHGLSVVVEISFSFIKDVLDYSCF